MLWPVDRRGGLLPFFQKHKITQVTIHSALDNTVKSTTMAKEFGNIYAENIGYPQTIPALRVEIYEDGYEVEERIIPVTKNQQRYVMSLTQEKRVKYISKKIGIN